MIKRYDSFGSDKTYRWLWRAALQDGIFAFKRIPRRFTFGAQLLFKC